MALECAYSSYSSYCSRPAVCTLLLPRPVPGTCDGMLTVEIRLKMAKGNLKFPALPEAVI